MKRVYCMLFLLTLFLACHSNQPINEKLLPLVEKIYGKPTEIALYERHFFYIFVVPDTAIGKYSVAKNAIDKCLNMLPTDHETYNGISIEKYEWETPQYAVIWAIYQKIDDERFYIRLEIILK